jgi:hypothetical protein
MTPRWVREIATSLRSPHDALKGSLYLGIIKYT